MRVSDIVNYPIQTSAFSVDPLRARRQLVGEQFAAGPAASVQLDTTALRSSPLRDFIAEARRDVVYGLRPLGQLAESVKTSSTPACTRGQYQMVAGEDLSISVELGPLLWHHTQRGGGIGRLIDTFA